MGGTVVLLPEGEVGLLGEVGGEEAERLALVGRQRGTVALEVAGDAAAGGARAVAEGLDAALSLQLRSRSHYIPGGGLGHGVGQSLPEAFVAGVHGAIVVTRHAEALRPAATHLQQGHAAPLKLT